MNVEQLLETENGYVVGSEAWFYAASPDSEMWSGPFDTEAEAIKEGRAEFPNAVFSIGKGRRADVTRAVDADDIYTRMSEIEGTFWLDDPIEMWWGTTREQDNDLERRVRKAIAEWQVAHGHLPPFAVTFEKAVAALPEEQEPS